MDGDDFLHNIEVVATGILHTYRGCITFQDETEAVKLSMFSWSSPHLEKPTKIFTDCKFLVEFLKMGDESDLLC
jgi:hypothetical protein